jgi:hypothetical protein
MGRVRVYVYNYTRVLTQPEFDTNACSPVLDVFYCVCWVVACAHFQFWLCDGVFEAFYFLVEAKMYVLLEKEGCSMLKIIEGAWMSLLLYIWERLL